MSRLLLLLLLVSAAWAQAAFQILHAQSASDKVIGGEPIRILVQLSGPAAGNGDLPVTTNHPELCQALPIPVGAGQSQIRFSVPTRAVDTPTQVIVSVGAYGTVRDLQVLLEPEAPNVTQMRVAPRMISGDTGSVTITLDRPSPHSARLNLKANENLTIVTPLPIPPGVRQFEAPFTTKVLRQGGKGALTYQGTRTLTAETQLLPPVEVVERQFTPAQLEGGQSGHATITLKAPAGAAAKVKLSGPANLRLPADVTVAEGSTTGQFTYTAATTRTTQNCTVTAATPLGQSSGRLTVTATTSLAAAEAAQYYLMASSKDGWMEVLDSTGKKWRFKPNGGPKMGKLEAFGYTATVTGEGSPANDSTPRRVVVQLRITGSEQAWKVAEATVLEVDN